MAERLPQGRAPPARGGRRCASAFHAPEPAGCAGALVAARRPSVDEDVGRERGLDGVERSEPARVAGVGEPERRQAQQLGVEWQAAVPVRVARPGRARHGRADVRRRVASLERVEQLAQDEGRRRVRRAGSYTHGPASRGSPRAVRARSPGGRRGRAASFVVQKRFHKPLPEPAHRRARLLGETKPVHDGRGSGPRADPRRAARRGYPSSRDAWAARPSRRRRARPSGHA